MKLKPSLLMAAILAVGPLGAPIWAQAATETAPNHSYTAALQSMNAAAIDFSTSGNATFDIQGDQLTIDIKVEGAPPNITHWQHFHGLQGRMAADCATPAADINADGYVDLIETEPASGVTMVPFDKMPAAMDVAHGKYPMASTSGTYHYHQVVSVKALSAAFTKAFDGQALDLDKRVLLIHGVAAETNLPPTVQSLGPIPAQVTLPIACGKIERTDR
ncbi:hypothetical protein KVP09_10745 [Alcaligenaceae bacterium CGII-47]|nr:hypothetical protein [Alcaligenaceae bacterium CGII-47]